MNFGTIRRYDGPRRLRNPVEFPCWDIYGGTSGFKQDGSYLPKTKDHVRDDWRRRKGFSKDRSKGNQWCKCGRYLKEVGSRKHRRWERQMVHHEKYDAIYWHQDMFVSSWDAC